MVALLEAEHGVRPRFITGDWRGISGAEDGALALEILSAG